MMKNPLLLSFLATVILFACKKKDDPVPSVKLSFSVQISNSSVVPAEIKCTNTSSDYKSLRRWEYGSISFSEADTLKYSVTEEGVQNITLSLIDLNDQAKNLSTSFILYSADKDSASALTPEKVTCKGFNLGDTLHFSFEENSNENSFDQTVFHEVKNTSWINDIDASVNGGASKETLFEDSSNGEGIWTSNSTMTANGRTYQFNYKFYISIKEGCLNEVKYFPL